LLKFRIKRYQTHQLMKLSLIKSKQIKTKDIKAKAEVNQEKGDWIKITLILIILKTK